MHLRGIQLLNISHCRQLTDAAFVHLRGIHTLYMRYCYQPAISDAAFVHLRGIHTLVMSYCHHEEITGSGFAHLLGISFLGMQGIPIYMLFRASQRGLPVKMRCLSMGELYYNFDELER